MKIHYTITTKYCPYCGRVLSKKTNLFLFYLYVLIFPIIIFCLPATYLLKKFIYHDPDIPEVGKSFKKCPSCANNIYTGKTELKDLSDIELLNYKFKWLFRLSYFLGGIILFFLFISIVSLLSAPYIDSSILYVLPLIIVSMIIIGIIAFIYKKKLKNLI